jgi:hypothetical protein
MTPVVTVGFDAALAPWAPEVKYVLRTLLASAGFAAHFVRVSDSPLRRSCDIYYGPRRALQTNVVDIEWCGQAFDSEPRDVRYSADLPWLLFVENGCGFERRADSLRFRSDIVLGCYWLLTGAAEPRYPRDRWGNLDLDSSLFLRHGLASQPLVSEYASLIERHLESLGRSPAPRPWTAPDGGPGFAISHDVDYPEMIRSIECLRLLRARGKKALPLIGGVMRGTNHFWKFADWLEFESEIGARSAFYFMARRGSLLQYAMGTPDAFYDIRSPRFRELFRTLTDAGSEIGLHASFHAYRDAARLEQEKQAVENVAGVRVEGNRHHYWHLDPASPNDTLRLHEKAGLLYDSSLGFEFYPGFRRGICHPFRPFHAGERRALNVVQLPPAWMDDHFDRRLAKNRIADPVDYARGLVRTAGRTGGVVVVDYHARGMNGDFYPRFGPWLRDFVERRMHIPVRYHTPAGIARMYIQYEKTLAEFAQQFNQAEVMA